MSCSQRHGHISGIFAFIVRFHQRCVVSAEGGELELPYHGTMHRLRAARIRAGIDVETLEKGSVSGLQSGMRPAVVASVAMEDFVISLPYGEEIGMAIRSTELWGKAFRQVQCLIPHLFP